MNNTEKLELFKEELEVLEIAYKDFVSKILTEIQEDFYVRPASVTGKYHPSYANGEGGLVRHTKAAVKIVVLNNGYLGMVRQWQELFFEKRYASTEMVSPNFVKLAERCLPTIKFGS